MLVAFEEAIARLAETLPHGIGLRLSDGPDRLPFRLQFLQSSGCRIPIGGVCQSFCLHAECFLLREVDGPLVLAPLEIFLPTREEPIARGAEPFPHRFLLAAADRTNGLPLGLQRLNL